MKEHNKNFYSLEELKRTRDSLEGYLDNEEVYYFVGAIRYACDEIERLNNIILDLENERDVLKSKLSETKADIKYLLEYGEGNGYIRDKYIRGDKDEQNILIHNEH